MNSETQRIGIRWRQISLVATTWLATTAILFAFHWAPRSLVDLVFNFWSVLLCVIGASFFVFFRFLWPRSVAHDRPLARTFIAASLAVANYLAAINVVFAISVIMFGE